MLENLATSDGPDLHVWLTDRPVIEGSAGWYLFDDGRYVELGPLKANNGNQRRDQQENSVVVDHSPGLVCYAVNLDLAVDHHA